MALEGLGRYASALLLALIHPTSWKGNSRKSICRILHKITGLGTEGGDFSVRNRRATLYLAVPYKDAAPCIALEGNEASPSSPPSEFSVSH